MSDLVLMTGASGFLGRRLLQAWLRRTSARVVACVRPRNGRSPAERLALAADGDEAVLHDAFAQRVTVLSADLDQPDLGLTAPIRSELTGSITHIVHCGGVVRFDLPLEVVRRTNTAGTARMLDLARHCPRLRRFDHISTAFVAGCRRGRVLERELDQGQRHHNSYELSKFEGELLVREAASSLPVAVYRPSIITCDVRTGEASRHGAVARLLQAYAAGVLTGLPGGAEARLDLVPADFVAEAALALGRTESINNIRVVWYRPEERELYVFEIFRQTASRMRITIPPPAPIYHAGATYMPDPPPSLLQPTRNSTFDFVH